VAAALALQLIKAIASDFEARAGPGWQMIARAAVVGGEHS
jgi:hypothetical protein